MRTSSHRRSGISATAARRAEQRLQAALRAQSSAAPDLFSDRDDDAAEYAGILRDFVNAHEEELGAERYS